MKELLKIEEIAALTDGELIGDGSVGVAHIATDSRSLFRSSQVIFVAICGDRHNGNEYIADVIQKGVKCILTDQYPVEINKDASYCIVKDALKALQLLAAYKRKFFQGTVIAITGSNGKTIVKEWLYQVLQRKSKVIRSPRSYNSQLGVALSVWQLTNRYKYGIIEAGISQPGEMQVLEKIIAPEIGILTNLGTAHGENFTSDSQKIKEKLQLFENCQKLIFNADIEVDEKSIHSFMIDADYEKVDWSLSGKARYTYKLISSGESKSKVELLHSENYSIFELPFTDRASIENSLQVITCLLESDMTIEEIKDGTKVLEPIEMRLETLNGVNGSTLVNDVYNSDLAGLEVALNVLEQQKGHKRKIVILSEVFQSGMKGEDLYSEVAQLLEFRNIDKLFCVGDALSAFKEIFPLNTEFFSNTETFTNQFNIKEIENSAVLIKGARKYHFEEITQLLQLKYHKTVLEINVNELIQNLNYFRSLLHSETKIMVMVKALSYGSGGDEIAAFLQHEKIDYLGVAYPDEGIRLRKAGLNTPIMVINADIEDYRSLFVYDLEPVIYSRKGLEEFMNQCKFLGRQDYPMHIKLDTGMHRLGFEEDDIDWLCEKIANEELEIKSIFTHLVGSDNQKMDDFTEMQVNRFITMSDRLMEASGSDIIRHVLNSAGIERFAGYQFDMVRIGIGLYGQGFSKKLAPVSTFKTAISQIRSVKKGDTVGYDRRGKVLTDSTIATIPVGYADGIDRRLGNGNFSFYLHNKRVATIGNICMDMTMIDVSETNAKVGDSVELFGNNIAVSEIAEKLDTIVYEILTSIPERVKRIYIKE